MGGGITRIVAVAIGAVMFATLAGIGHILWTRSADSEIVHYSWPVKWALTFVSESPDLPASSRFTTVAVKNVGDDDRWTVTGEVELPSSEDRRLVTTFAATVRSQCAEVSTRRCWTMDELTLGSVPATMPIPPGDIPTIERGPPPAVAALPSTVGEPAALPEPATPPAQGKADRDEASEAEQDEDLAFVLSEPLAEPAEAPPLALSDPPPIAKPSTAGPSHDPALVSDIQRGLAALGYDPGPIDGIPGQRTRAALESFRVDEGMASAAIGPELLNEITRRRPPGEPAPLQMFAPIELRQPQAPEEPSRRCFAINLKNRDCGD